MKRPVGETTCRRNDRFPVEVFDNSEPATGMYRQRLVKNLIKYGGLHLRLCILFAGLRTGEQSRRRCEWIIIGLFTSIMYCI